MLKDQGTIFKNTKNTNLLSGVSSDQDHGEKVIHTTNRQQTTDL